MVKSWLIWGLIPLVAESSANSCPPLRPARRGRHFTRLKCHEISARQRPHRYNDAAGTVPCPSRTDEGILTLPDCKSVLVMQSRQSLAAALEPAVLDRLTRQCVREILRKSESSTDRILPTIWVPATVAERISRPPAPAAYGRFRDVHSGNGTWYRSPDGIDRY